jgi:glycosyltransferase involved in cell wall biosynthesis
MNVLIISNMGPKKSAPTLGLFVEKQVKRLKELLPNVEYFHLTFNGDSLLHQVLKYPVFFLTFFLKYIFSRQRIDIIHVHYYYPTIFCALLYKYLRSPKVKILVTCHGGDIYCYNPPSKSYKYCSKLVEHWFFTSKKLAESFYRKVNSYDILCAGYDETIFTANLSQQTHKSIDCLLVGHLDKNKGIDRLITLVETMPTIKFAVVGAGSMASELEQHAIKNNNLILLGCKKPIELAAIYQKTRFLLSLSRNESFGLVICEAHACGTPCIVTETAGSLEQLANWPYMIYQQNKSEKDIIDQLQQKINTALNLSKYDYHLLQQQVMQKVQQYSLSNIVSIIAKRYGELYQIRRDHNNV